MRNKLEIKPRVVRPHSYWSFKMQRVIPHTPLPRRRAIDVHGEKSTVEQRVQRVLAALHDFWHRPAKCAANIRIARISAFRVSMLPRIAFDGDHEARNRTDSPHYIEHVAIILRLQFQPDLGALPTGKQLRAVFGLSQITKSEFRFRFAGQSEHSAHFGGFNPHPRRLSGNNAPFCDAELLSRIYRRLFRRHKAAPPKGY